MQNNSLQLPAVPRYTLACLVLLVLLVPLLLWHHAIATIPTPTNISLVSGYLRWDNDQWSMNVKTGQVQQVRDPDLVLYDGGKRFGIDYLADTDQIAVTVDVANPDSTPTTEPVIVDLPSVHTIVNGRYLAYENETHWRIVDSENFEDGYLTLDHQDSPSYDAILIGVPGTNRFLHVHGMNSPRRLFQIDANEIRLIDSWTTQGDVSYCNGRFYVIETHKQMVEVRSAADGSFIESIPFPDCSDVLDGPPHASINEDILRLYDREFKRFVAYDLKRKVRLKLPSPDYVAVASTQSRHIFLSSHRLGRNHEQLVYDRDSDSVIQRLRSPIYFDNFDVIDEAHVLFTGRAHGVSAVLMDITSGREVERWVPFAWLSWSTLLFCPLMLLWVILWCRTAARVHDWAWMDIGLVGGILAFMASYRIGDDYFLQDASFLKCAILLLGVIQCASWWLVLARQNFVWRASVLCLMLGLGHLVCNYWIDSSREYLRWELLQAAVLVCTFTIMMAGWIRWLGLGITRAENVSERSSVRHIMLLTVAMAVFVNAVRMTMPLPDSVWQDEIVVYLTVPGVIGMVGLAIGLGNRQGWFVVASVWSVATLLLIVGYRLIDLFTGATPMRIWATVWYPEALLDSFDESIFELWYRLGEAVAIGVVAPFLATLPLRLRGWRLGRSVAC